MGNVALVSDDSSTAVDGVTAAPDDGQGDSTDGAHPWSVSVDVVSARHGADLVRGLDDTEVARRLAAVGPNELTATDAVPWWRRFLAQFTDPLVALLLAAIAISLAAWALEGAEEVPFEAIVIAVIVAANAVIGLWQEARAEAAVAALSRMAAPIAPRSTRWRRLRCRHRCRCARRHRAARRRRCRVR